MKPELSLSGGTKSKVSLALNANKELCAECKKNVMRTTQLVSCGNDCFNNKNQNPPRKSKRNNNGNMDLLHKFRYNFHYWLKNAYQSGDADQQI